jgi:putative hemolysin
VTWEDWKLEIVDMDGRSIDKVLATRLPTDRIEGTDEVLHPV